MESASDACDVCDSRDACNACDACNDSSVKYAERSVPLVLVSGPRR